MEYYYRCTKCGRRTPSFEYEEHLNNYALDWKIDDNDKICPQCQQNEINKIDRYTSIILIICLIIIILLFLIF